MKIVTFRYQKFNSASNESKKYPEKQFPNFPFGQINQIIGWESDDENKKNLQQIQKIGQNRDIILGSWQ